MLVDHLQKTKKEWKKPNKTGGSWYIYQNEPDRNCFQHDMAYGYFKGLARRTAFDKIFRNKTFNIVKIQNIMDNTNQLSENLRKEKYSCFLHIIFGVLTLLIYN